MEKKCFYNKNKYKIPLYTKPRPAWLAQLNICRKRLTK